MNSSSRIVLRLDAPCSHHAQELAQLAELPDPPAPGPLRVHLQDCIPCRSFLEALRQQSASLRSLCVSGSRPPSPQDQSLTQRVEGNNRRYLASDVIDFARQLLLLDPDFEAAFPITEGSVPVSGLIPLLQRLRMRLHRSETEEPLHQHLRERLELIQPLDSSGTPRSPTLLHKTRLQLAADLLSGAMQLDEQSSQAYLVRAQMSWVFGSLEAVPQDLERALVRCRRPLLTGLVLLHQAIWQADQGDMPGALHSVTRAIRLAPHHLAVQLTMGVYAASMGLSSLAGNSLRAASQLGAPSDRVRRLLSVRQQLRSLSQIGVFPMSAVEPQARDILGIVSSTLPSSSAWIRHATA